VGELANRLDHSLKDHWRSARAWGFTVGLACASADVLLSAVGRPDSLRPLPMALAILVASLIAVMVAYWALWCVVVFAAGRRLRLSPSPVGFAVALAVCPLMAIARGGWLATASPSLRSVVLVCLVLGACLALAALGYLSFVSRPSELATVGLMLRVFSWVCLEALGFGWVLIYVVPLRPLRVETLSILLSFGFTVAATVLLAVAQGWRKRLSIWFFCAAAVIGAAILSVTLVQADRAHPSAVATRGGGPNVILITIDSLRWDAVSCYNSTSGLTPNIDRLAADSLRFNLAFSPGPWTQPAITAVLTGLSPAATGLPAIPHRLPGAVPTLAATMDEAGYLTAAFVESPWLRPEFNIGKGFRSYSCFPKMYGNSLGEWIVERLFPTTFFREAKGSRLTGMAKTWLQGHRGDHFLLWVHYFDTHTPYAPPKEYWPRGKPPAAMGMAFSDEETVMVIAGSRGRLGEERAWIRALYDAEVRNVDACVGQLIAELKRLGLYERSVVVLASDHGEEFWDHGAYWHGHTLYNELIRVPLLIKLPMNRPTGVVERPVSTGSVTPTVLDVCGLGSARRALMFESLAARTAEELGALATRDLVSTGTYRFEDQECIIVGFSKYIRGMTSGKEEVYDVRGDPQERGCGEIRSSAEVAELRAHLAAFKDRERKLRGVFFSTPEASPQPEKLLLERLRSLGYVN